MYTGHIDPNLMHARVEEEVRQYQNLAIYNENGTVTKYENNPVIGEKELPKGYKICDFRDPKVYKRGYSYYCILSVRNKDDVGSIVLYKSNDLINWDFFSEIYTSNPLDNILYECADLFQIDDKDVLIYSVMPARGEHSKVVKNCVKYAIGYMNYEKGVFEEDTVGLLDYGASFYAPQTTMDENGNVIIIGWLCERCEDTKKYLEEYKYNGIMSMVRELKIVDNKLISIPINNIKNFFRDEVVYENIKLNGEVELDYISGKATYIHLDIKEINKEIKISLFNKDDKSFDFIFSNNAISYLSSYTAKNNNTINIDTIKNIEIFIDNHVIEVFINNGEKVITELCYDSNKGDKIKFIGNKETISKITKYSV